MTLVKKVAGSNDANTRHPNGAAATRATTFKVAVESDCQESVCLHNMIVPVVLRSEDDPNRQAIAFAVLESQSDACFMTETTLQKVGGT